MKKFIIEVVSLKEWEEIEMGLAAVDRWSIPNIWDKENNRLVTYSDPSFLEKLNKKAKT